MKVNKNMKFKGSKRPRFNQKTNTQQEDDVPKVPEKLTRKALRKQARLDKKARKHAYFTHQRLPAAVEDIVSDLQKAKETVKPKVKDAEKEKKKLKQKLEKQQLKRRREFMLEENEREEKQIAQLEKRLKIHRRKSKSLPQLFVKDGLDYLLDVCDTEKIPHLREPELSDAESDFQDDLTLATGQTETKDEPEKIGKKNKKVTFAPTLADDAVSDSEQSEGSEQFGSDDSDNEEQHQEEDSEEELSGDEYESNEESDEDGPGSKDSPDEEIMEDSDGEEKVPSKGKDDARKNGEGWEDIYGRLRDKDGNVIETKSEAKFQRFIPPALRQASDEVDSKRLKSQLKWILNGLNEMSISPVASEIEELYMHNTRNDMNNVLIDLVMEFINDVHPLNENSVKVYALLIALLHANVGTEVGARFLEAVADKFEMLRKQGENYGEGCECENLFYLLVHMYSFKVVHASLIYDILHVLADSFKEKDVKLINTIFESVGFSLRKDDPLGLKSLIGKLQSQASASTQMKTEIGVIHMLDIVMAIRNNNTRKIPHYDQSQSEHLKKLLRSLIRKGNSLVELKISLDDLLNSESRGRWWIIGSAWSGQEASQDDSKKGSSGQMAFDATDNVSTKILELARKQRMNTDVRKNIFCIIMSAEDYIDAFEKLLRLGLSNQQEREILHVAIDCCLQEKTFNPYYAFLMQRFCNSDRKYQMIIQFAVWDKIKEMVSLSAAQLSNLAHLLAHLFLEKAVAISVLKVIEFAEMDKASVRLLRQILLEILLHDSEENVLAVFSKVAKAPKLHMFREGLRLFMRHFLLRNKEKHPSETFGKLEARINAAEDVLTSCEVATKF